MKKCVRYAVLINESNVAWKTSFKASVIIEMIYNYITPLMMLRSYSLLRRSRDGEELIGPSLFHHDYMVSFMHTSQIHYLYIVYRIRNCVYNSTCACQSNVRILLIEFPTCSSSRRKLHSLVMYNYNVVPSCLSQWNRLFALIVACHVGITSVIYRSSNVWVVISFDNPWLK